MTEEVRKIIENAWNNRHADNDIEIVSNCCSAPAEYFDICSKCKEHADFINLGEDE